MKKKKAIVIGAGVSGLVCAAKLAKESNLEVTLIESWNQVGGLSQGWESKVRLDNDEQVKAKFELTHVISEMMPGERFHKLYEELGVDWGKVGEFIPSKKLASMTTENGRVFELLNGFEENKEMFKRRYPSEAQNIEAYFKILDKIHHEFPAAKYRKDGWFKKGLETIFEQRFEKYPLLKKMLYAATKPTFVKLHKHTHKALLDEYFKNEDLKTNFSVVSGYMGVPPSKAPSLLMALVNLSMWKSKGPCFPGYNSYQVLHDELAEAIKRNGGDVRLNSIVSDIKVENSQIAGVEVNSRTNKIGKYNLAADYVVIAGDLKKSLLPLREYLPEKYVEHLEGMKMSTSFMMVNTIVDGNGFDMRGIEEYASNIAVSSVDAIELAGGHNFPEHYKLFVAGPSLHRPNANHIVDLNGNSLVGKYHRIDIGTYSPQYKELAKLGYKSEAYKNKKREVIEQIIDIADKFYPGIKNSIKYQQTYTALTHERFCHVTEGANYAFEQNVEQFPPNRISPITPIKGLYATGAGTLAGGIVAVIAAGEKTADLILKEL